jgi:hypothetical protein
MVFVSFRKLFSDNTRVRIFIFFVARKALIFSPEFNIRLYDKNSESDYIFFLHQNQNIFLEKKTLSSLPFKLDGRSLGKFMTELVLWNLLQVYLAALRWTISSLLMLDLV